MKHLYHPMLPTRIKQPRGGMIHFSLSAVQGGSGQRWARVFVHNRPIAGKNLMSARHALHPAASIAVQGGKRRAGTIHTARRRAGLGPL